MSKGLKNKILDLYNQGIPYKKIATILNCSSGSVCYYCTPLTREKSPYSKEKIESYQNYYNEHLSVKATADHFGLSRKTLSKYIQQRILTKEKRRKKAVYRRTLYRQKIKKLAIEYKGGCCEKCGYNKCLSALDFHHLNPEEKEFTISGGTKSFENIKKELDKCMLLCRNCHAEEHERLFNESLKFGS